MQHAAKYKKNSRKFTNHTVKPKNTKTPYEKKSQIQKQRIKNLKKRRKTT